jgi:hypothetical protein
MDVRHIPKALAACVLVLGFALGKGAAATPALPLAAAGGAQTFLDPTGDAGAPPDITSVTVRNDPLTGVIRISASAAGLLATDPAAEPAIEVYLDTHGAGAPNCNCNYVLRFLKEREGEVAELFRWYGKWLSVPSTTPSFFQRDGETLTWRIKRSEVGINGDFTFYVVADYLDAAGKLVVSDTAPDLGAWAYDFSAPVKPLIGPPRLTPAAPVAGKRVAVSFPVMRSDDGQPLTLATMTCVAIAEGKVIAQDRAAHLSFLVPKRAKGKQLQVRLTVRTGAGESATKTASFRVR